MLKIFSGMSKGEAAILFSLLGIILGMIVSAFFLKFTISIPQLEEDIAISCVKSEPAKLHVYLFGTRISVECKNGQMNHYNLILHGNSTDIHNNP